MPHDPDRRARVLEACGAQPSHIESLLAYTATPYDALPAAAAGFPLSDEPHVEAWERCAADARSVGAFHALRRRFVQLQFPVRAGISDLDAYRRATRRGLFGEAAPYAPGLALGDPAGLELWIHQSLAGRIPVLVPATRPDFAALVQAFTERNEPVPVPDPMGACLVNGLNNWSRVEDYRDQWRAAKGAEATDEAWSAEFEVLARDKARYQDRFIILSRGPYSATPAEDAGVPEPEWLRRSLAIRLEHECMHYLTYRCAGLIRSNALDELLADFAGLAAATGAYSARLALRFLGLDGFPPIRPGSRLLVYRGHPPLPDEAMPVVAKLAVRAAGQLERIALDAGASLRDPAALGRLVTSLAACTLEELAEGIVSVPPSRTGAPR